MYEGYFWASTGTEVSAEAEMNSCENTVKDISSDILRTKKDNACIGSKESNYWSRDKLDDNCYDNTEAYGYHDCIA